MRIGDWSSDVCSSDLRPGPRRPDVGPSMSEPIAPGPSAAPANGAPAVRWRWLLVGPLLALLLVAGRAAALIASGGDGDARDAHARGSAPPPEPIGRAPCGTSVCQYGLIRVVDG